MVRMKSKLVKLLISLVIAMGLWLYVVTNVSQEFTQTFSSTVTLENESVLLDRGLILVSGYDSKVSFVLKGNRADMNKITDESLKVTADLGEIVEPGQHKIVYRVSYPGGGGVSLEKRITQTVTVEVAEYASKPIPVQLVLQGEQQENVFIDREGAITSTSTVMVSGPKEEVDKIAMAGIVLDVTELGETLSGEYVYTLMDAEGEPVKSDNITTDTGEIHVMLPVEHIKELPLRVELVEGGGIKQENAKVQLSAETITVSGSKEAVEKLDELVVATINLSEVELGKLFRQEVAVKLPENLTNHSGLDKVTLELSLRDVTSKTIKVPQSRIRMLNVPEGYQGTIFNLELDVIIRGPAEQVSAVTLDDLVVSVDFKDQQLGTYTMPVNMTVTGAKDVGFFGKYSVTVTLAPAPIVEESLPEEG